MSVSCFKEGKSYSISEKDVEISEHPVYLKTIIATKTVVLFLSSLAIFYHPEFLVALLY